MVSTDKTIENKITVNRTNMLAWTTGSNCKLNFLSCLFCERLRKPSAKLQLLAHDHAPIICLLNFTDISLIEFLPNHMGNGSQVSRSCKQAFGRRAVSLVFYLLAIFVTSSGNPLVDCDRHGLCKTIVRIFLEDKDECDNEADCTRADKADCANDQALSNKYYCNAADCIEIQSLASSYEACHHWFPISDNTDLGSRSAAFNLRGQWFFFIARAGN